MEFLCFCFVHFFSLHKKMFTDSSEEVTITMHRQKLTDSRQADRCSNSAFVATTRHPAIQFQIFEICYLQRVVFLPTKTSLAQESAGRCIKQTSEALPLRKLKCPGIDSPRWSGFSD